MEFELVDYETQHPLSGRKRREWDGVLGCLNARGAREWYARKNERRKCEIQVESRAESESDEKKKPKNERDECESRNGQLVVQKWYSGWRSIVVEIYFCVCC